MARMSVVQVPSPGVAFEVVEREIPAPTSGTVRIRVEACGVCHYSAAEQYLPRMGLCRVTADPHIIGTLKNDIVENK